MIVDDQNEGENQTLPKQDGTIMKAQFTDLPENEDNVLFQPKMAKETAATSNETIEKINHEAVDLDSNML